MARYWAGHDATDATQRYGFTKATRNPAEMPELFIGAVRETARLDGGRIAARVYRALASQSGRPAAAEIADCKNPQIARPAK